jgi:hypothetical protein
MSALTINEVRRRLQAFSKEHENDSDEKQHAQQFWRDFYACFGLSKSSASMFEARVAKINGKRGYIDSFIPSLLLVEQKSLNRDLQNAYEQALEYALAVKDEAEKPRYIITCDFQTFHVYDLHGTSKEPLICKLNELHKHASWFMFLAEKKLETIVEETPINRKAAYQISKLHDKLLEDNFVGKDLELFLTRLLFCLFADDTGIFGEDNQFTNYIQNTREDGSDTGSAIATLFQVLNTAHDKRQTSLDERLKAFAYVNGSLFEERTEIPYFNYDLRKILIECAILDWSDISPAIFGAMFQAVLEENATDNKDRKDTRRELGAHYTSERNILKVIQPLFLDSLWDEFEAAKNNKVRLTNLYEKLPTLTFFDPACGCGNFLVVAYRELRKLENEIIEQLFFKSGAGGLLDVATLCRVNVGQFYGIEIDEAASHIARVAMYITDHQSNLLAASKFGATRATVPLITTPHIRCGNALRTDWNEVLQAENCSYVLGNPPFIGKQWQTEQQKEDMQLIAGHIKNFGLLDYVSAWYIKAADYIKKIETEIAFVSTNSITQGEQVAVLWPYLFSKSLTINFAHRTFKWGNEGKANAAVHCVIVGFGLRSREKIIFDYVDGISSEPISIKAKHINAYLVDGPNVVLENRKNPIFNVPNIVFGSMANDGGNLLLNDKEKEELLKKCPLASKWIHKFVGADEFINNINRWCLWLKNIKPEELKLMPDVYERVLKVKEVREKSQRPSTKNLALTPYLFGEIRQPESGSYLLIPRVSSERRTYLPVGFLDADVIASDATLVIPNATFLQFSVLNSSMHNAWMRIVCGRLKSDYRYSNGIVYNNFVWPNNTVEIEEKLALSAQLILDARSFYATSSLASLYDPLTMPIELVKAHELNNKAVDKAYGYKGDDNDASRVAFLLKLYEQTTSLLPSQNKAKKKAK